MANRRFFSILLLLSLTAFPASASMVSFLLVETGIAGEETVTQYSSLWEGGLLSAFFDAGYIVTNSPILRMERRTEPDFSGAVEDDFNAAASGGAEYFIVAFLEYQMRDGEALPVGINLKVYTIGSKRLIFEHNFPAGTGKNLNEEYQFALDAGRTIISRL